MGQLTLRLASNLIGYTFAEVTVPVPDDITPEEIAQRHWDANMQFLLAQERIANEPVTEKQEAAISKAAKGIVDVELPATVVAEEEAEHKVGDTVTVAGIEFTKHSEAPWDNPPAPTTEKKPWENKPSFDLF